MTRNELNDKLERIKKKVKEIREYLLQEKVAIVTKAASPLQTDPDFQQRYTLEDLYRGFGGKVSLARRFKSALQKRNINTLENFFHSPLANC